MLLLDVTKILKVLLGTFAAVASQDALTQRRIGQISEMIGAVDDVSATEAETNSTVVDKRVEEAHDIIHRVAAILAMEENKSYGEGSDGVGSGNSGTEVSSGPCEDDLLPEVPWDGKLDGETFDMVEDEGE